MSNFTITIDVKCACGSSYPLELNYDEINRYLKEGYSTITTICNGRGCLERVQVDLLKAREQCHKQFAFAIEFQRLRLATGHTLKTLSAATDVPLDKLEKYEAGEVMPTNGIIKDMAICLRVNPLYLIDL
jgi:hypothetical protein